MRARTGLRASVDGGGRGRHVGTTTSEHKSELRWSVNGDSMCARTREVGKSRSSWTGDRFMRKDIQKDHVIEEFSGGKVLVFRSGCIPRQA